VTRQIIQSKYESLYIGPEFYIEQRLAQLIAVIWTAFFFMPAFPAIFAYLIAIIFVFYWFDKVLFLRFYRVPRNSDDKTIAYAIHLLKYSFLWHAIMGTFLLSNQNIFSTKTYFTAYIGDANALLESWTGGKIFIAERYAQGHVILFWVFMIIILLLIWNEDMISSFLLSLPGIKLFYQRPLAKMEAVSDDFYDVVQPTFLIKQYQRAIEVKHQVMDFIAHNQHRTEFFEQFRTEVAAFLVQTVQKEALISAKIRTLANKLGYSSFPDMQARCEKVLDHIDKANRVVNSRMTSDIQSYDHRDNGHYVAMLALEELLQKPIDED